MDIQVVDSGIGIKSWLSTEGDTPALIAIDVAWEGGATQDKKGKEGLASFATSMLTEGAGPWTSEEFHEKVADLAAHISCDTTYDYTTCHITMLAHTRKDVFELLKTMFEKPRLDQDAIERVKFQYHSMIRSNLENPNWLASHAFYTTAFPDHPYSRPLEGTDQSINSITKEDLEEHIKNTLARSNLKVSIVGPIDKEETVSFLRYVFGALPEKAQLQTIDNVSWHTGLRHEVSIENPQTVAVFGVPGPFLTDEDYIPAILLNYILGGGGFSSLIFQEVREKRGLAYSPYTLLAQKKHLAGFIGTVGTEKEKIEESLKIIQDILENLAHKGVTNQELSDAKNAIVGSYGLNFTSNDKKVSMLLNIQLKGFDVDYIKRYPNLIQAVPMEDIQRVAKKYLSAKPTLGLAGDYTLQKLTK